MTLPAFLFGVLVSSFLGAVAHLLAGGGPGRLLLFLFLGWAGFWFGHFLGTRLHWTFLAVGPLHFGSAVLAALLLLGLGYWLSLVKVQADR